MGVSKARTTHNHPVEKTNGNILREFEIFLFPTDLSFQVFIIYSAASTPPLPLNSTPTPPWPELSTHSEQSPEHINHQQQDAPVQPPHRPSRETHHRAATVAATST